MNTRNLYFSAIFILILGILFGCESEKTAKQQEHSKEGSKVLSQQIQMPEFALSTWKGGEFHSDSQGDGVLVVMFFSTTCADCIKFLREVEDLHDSYPRKDFSFVAVSTGTFKKSLLEKVVNNRPFSFPVVIDQSRTLNKKFGPNPLLPITYLVTQERAIVKEYLGHPKPSILKTDIDALL